MSLQPNQVVSVHLSIKDKDGELIETTRENQPLAFISGRSQILPKLEEKIGSMLIKSQSTLELPPQDAFGEYKPEAVRKADRSNFPDDAKLKEGMSFVATNEEGQHIPFVIKNIENDDITIDFNHPYAGKTLKFDIELLDIREATEEEMAHGHVHGPGGHQH